MGAVVGELKLIVKLPLTDGSAALVPAAAETVAADAPAGVTDAHEVPTLISSTIIDAGVFEVLSCLKKIRCRLDISVAEELLAVASAAGSPLPSDVGLTHILAISLDVPDTN